MKRGTMLLTLEIAVPLALLALITWWTAQADSFFFPPVTEILEAFRETWLFDSFIDDALPSLYRLAAGYAMAVVAGVALGTIIGVSWRARRMSAPVVEFLRALPAPATVPFFILVFGIGDLAKILLIGLVTIWPVLLNTVDGIGGIDATLMETARMYHLGQKDMLFRVRLPAALPQIYAGMRTSLSLAVVLMVVSEMVASADGIGHSIIVAQSLFDIPKMWAGILLLGLLGYLLNLLFEIQERRVLRWHFGARAIDGRG